jgi:hypothetical protein
MLAQGMATVPYTSDVVAAALAVPGRPWSVALDSDGQNLMAKVGVKVAGIPLYKQVRLEIGSRPDGLRKDRIMLPVRWHTVGGPPLFPKMEGTLHVEPDGDGGTRLTLNATYDPPLGRLGQVIDRGLMHRLATMTMRDFVDRLAGALAEDLRHPKSTHPKTTHPKTTHFADRPDDPGISSE